MPEPMSASSAAGPISTAPPLIIETLTHVPLVAETFGYDTHKQPEGRRDNQHNRPATAHGLRLPRQTFRERQAPSEVINQIFRRQEKWQEQKR